MSGTLDLTTDTPQADLTASWKDLQLPAEWVGQALHSHGSLAGARGCRLQRSGNSRSVRMARWRISTSAIQGNTRSVELKRIQLKQANGGLQAKGTLTCNLSWPGRSRPTRKDSIRLHLRRAVAGAIEFALNSQGRLTDHGIEANLQMPRIGGRLRDRALGGSADLRLQPGNIVDGTDLQLSGQSH